MAVAGVFENRKIACGWLAIPEYYDLPWVTLLKA